MPEETQPEIIHPDKPIEPITRRTFLKRAGAFGAGIAATAIGGIGAIGDIGSITHGIHEANDRFLQPALQLKADWETAGVENAQFMEEHKDELKNIHLGCSLSPEQLDWLKIHDSPDRVLDYLQELGISDVRFGLRWNHSVDKDGKVDLSRYAPWIDGILKRGMDLCLNVGPIKVFRYPEDHVPEKVREDLEGKGQFPKKGALIGPEDPLAKKGLEYLNAMLPELKKLVGNHVVTMQPENEAHVPFGEHEWVASHEYFLKVCETIKNHFPDSPLLLNSPAVHQANSPLKHTSTLEQTATAAQAIVAAHPDWEVITGVDVYPDTPQSAEIPLTNGLRVDTQMAVESLRGRNVIPQYVEGMKKSSIRTEITELQVEPWKDRQKPGNDVQSLRFAVLRSLPFVDGTQPTTMRLWGIEHLYAQRAKGVETGEHQKIYELIRLINAQA